MNEFLISSQGVRIPKLIYGTAWKKEHTASFVERAIKLGFRGIDTACQPKHYNEAGVGEGVRAGMKDGVAREELYLQTKFTSVDGQDPRNIPYDPQADLPEQVRQSVARSLENLQTAYLDGLVLHSPLRRTQQTMDVWNEMQASVERGVVKQLGISNCHSLGLLEELYRKARIKPVIVQNAFHANTRYDRDIRAFCLQHEMLYQSFWTLTANPKVLAHSTIQELASRYHRSPAQIFFRYLTLEGVVPLTGTTSEAHMVADLAIFDFELQDNQREAVGLLLGNSK